MDDSKSLRHSKLLITVSGPDGSGKSTQIQLLLEALEKRGAKVTSVWFRPGYSPWLDQVRAAVRSRAPAVLPTSSDPSARQEVFSRPWVRVSWAALAVADSAVYHWVRVRRLQATHDVVICDRSIEDAALDLSLRFPELKRVTAAALGVIRMAGPKPDLAVVYSVPLKVAHQRCLDKNEPFADPLEIREARHAFYDVLAERPRVTRIDATDSAVEVHQKTLRALLRSASVA